MRLGPTEYCIKRLITNCKPCTYAYRVPKYILQHMNRSMIFWYWYKFGNKFLVGCTHLDLHTRSHQSREFHLSDRDTMDPENETCNIPVRV